MLLCVLSQGGCGGWVGGGWSLSHLLSTRDCSSPGACAWTLPTATSHQYWSVLTLAPPEPVYIHCTTEKGTNGKWSSWGSLMWTHCTVPLVCLVSLVCHSLSLQCLPLPPRHHQYHPQSSLKSPTMLFYHRLPTIGPSLSIIPMQHKLTWSWLGSEETRHTTTSILSLHEIKGSMPLLIL